ENIVLSSDRAGQAIPKLIDFGISKLSGSAGGAGTAGSDGPVLLTGRALGTPVYMSPEQLRAEESIDGLSDPWAVGVVRFGLFCGRRPCDGRSVGDLSVQILTGEASGLRTLASETGDDVAKVITRALQRQPEQRFATMRAMRAALLACRGAGAG